MKDIVINWHITEACNFKCEFCFSKWGNQKELWCNLEKSKMLIKKLYEKWGKNCRINFVGGEPLLFPQRIIPLIEYAADLEMKVSVQTNGSHFENIFPVADKICQIGISIDSWNKETNFAMGRCCNNKTLTIAEVREDLSILSSKNPSMRLKINSVVSRWNWNEEVITKMRGLNCDRIKILRQIPFGSERGITDEQFYFFIKNNWVEGLPIFIEDNDLMTESYLMISPDGRFFQNGHKNEYAYSLPILETDIENALGQINFDLDKFNERYEKDRTREIVKVAFQNK